MNHRPLTQGFVGGVAVVRGVFVVTLAGTLGAFGCRAGTGSGCVVHIDAQGGTGRSEITGELLTRAETEVPSGEAITGAQRAGCVYRGIPYAEPSVGERRWAAPTPLQTLPDAFDATRFGPVCPQIAASGVVVGREDCLTLNVWSPGMERDAAVPTMVFFHGGGNVRGSGSAPLYDGRHLAEAEQVVVVTANYRLGALGYLAHPEFSADPQSGDAGAAAPSDASSDDSQAVSSRDVGNYGLADQVTVLEWVRHHVAEFGGDPTNVTIFGQSAGGKAVCALMTSPSSRSLVHHAIIESGACELEPIDVGLAFAETFATAFGCTEDVALCLRAQSVEALVSELPELPTLLTSSVYGAFVGGPHLPEDPMQALSVGVSSEIDLIVGANTAEVRGFEPSLPSVDAYRLVLATLFGEERVEPLLARYPPSESETAEEAFVRLVTDMRYICPSHRTARAATAGGHATYHYLFDDGVDAASDATRFAVHELELAYVFGTFDAVGLPANADERALGRRMASFWAGLGKHGAPASEWPRYEGAQSFRLGPVSSALPSARTEHCAFWDSVRTPAK